jgi:hypothetical protein
MNFNDVIKGLEEDAKSFGVPQHQLDVDMYMIWHGFMRAYGYIPFYDFMNRMDCCQTINLLVNMKKEGDYINKETNKLKGRVKGLN